MKNERGLRARRAGKTVALAVGVGLMLSACAPHAITPTGRQTGTLYNIVLVMATAVFVAVEAAIIYMSVRYRRRKGDDESTLPEQVHGNRNIEIVWTAIPSVIVLALFVMSMVVLTNVNRQLCPDVGKPGVAGVAPTPATGGSPSAPCSGVQLVVNITGFQWQWKFDYYHNDGTPYGVSEVAASQTSPPTLVLPVGERIHFNETSPDVIHSFYVPAWLFKRDVVPGRTNSFELSIDPSAAGKTFHGQCAELCGDFHNEMTFNLRTLTPTEFNSWIAAEAAKQKKEGGCSPLPGAAGTQLKISAQNISFDTKCLAAPANQAFTVTFTNNDAGVQHNVEIYTNPAATTRLGGATGPGNTITGPATTTYSVKALPPGKYFFRCDVHPTAMFGTFVVK